MVVQIAMFNSMPIPDQSKSRFLESAIDNQNIDVSMSR